MSNPFATLGSEPDDEPASKVPFPVSEEERTLLIKSESFVYKIPPQGPDIKFLLQTKAVGWKATDWNLEKPDWKGKLRLTCKGKAAQIKLEEQGSGKLYAICHIDTYPGPAVQAVADSSRYFVIKISESEGGKVAHLGLGFADRSDSFDLNTTLHDHFKSLQVEDQIEQEKDIPQEKLDLALKEGETIKVSINIPRKNRTKSPANRGSAGLSLPPPPGPAGSIPAPPSPALAKLNISKRPPPAPSGGSQKWIQF
ncbi:NECAP-like protein CG9132 [Eurytemora carolleeae]|uniref:NECAP-like protein CG9132 n=1 Tax=Eurytemora carolleeae TaxID=1294199 RepID=UPI000C762C65|nr:NECAP-like protein CG9132 [Eurytemora carolleeae]|eukprot:XP_023335289.1 NECAP-like protein CG9132 [Eurytemora affinis]